MKIDRDRQTGRTPPNIPAIPYCAPHGSCASYTGQNFRQFDKLRLSEVTIYSCHLSSSFRNRFLLHLPTPAGKMSQTRQRKGGQVQRPYTHKNEQSLRRFICAVLRHRLSRAYEHRGAQLAHQE